MTVSWVMAAIIWSEPRRHKGQVTISRSNTRPSSRAQLQCSIPVLASSLSTPCWRGVGMIGDKYFKRYFYAALGGTRSQRGRWRRLHPTPSCLWCRLIRDTTSSRGSATYRPATRQLLGERRWGITEHPAHRMSLLSLILLAQFTIQIDSFGLSYSFVGNPHTPRSRPCPTASRVDNRSIGSRVWRTTSP